MIFSWLTRRRRRRLLAEPFPAAWLDYLDGNVRHYACLEPGRQAVVQNVVQVFVAEKHWAGGGGLSVTDEMKVTVAAQASLLVLGFPELYYYDQVPSIIVYPRQYVYPRRIQEQYHLIVREDWELRGQAWYRGPIVLSWEDVLAGGRNASAGRNVVLHEFAHHLDALNGDFDGMPPLRSRQQEDWHRVTEAEYLRLVGSAQRNDVTLLDHYGATNRVEFFAVATECFFEHPSAMKRLHAELYDVLRGFYRQDPAQWCPDASLPSDRRATDWTDARDVDKTDPVRESEWEARLASSKKVKSLFRLGLECLDDKRYDLASRAFSRVLELAPTDAEAYHRRALARARLGEYTAALSDAEEALRLDGDDVGGQFARGAALLGMRQYKQAGDDLDCVLWEEPNNAEAYYLRGLARAGLGKWRRAVSDFSSSITFRPYSAEVYFHRAHAYRRLGSSAKADADLEKAFQLDPHVGWRE